MSSKADVSGAGIFFAAYRLQVQIAIHIQPVIMSHHNSVVISCEVFAIIRKKIVTAAIGKPAPVHVDHDGAFVGTIDLGCPKIKAQAVLTGYRGSCATMEYECIFIRIREILSIGVEVSGILVGTDPTILQRVANSGPRLGTRRGREAPCTGCGSTIGHAFENVHAVPPKAADFSSGRFRDGPARGNHLAISTAGREGLFGRSCHDPLCSDFWEQDASTCPSRSQSCSLANEQTPSLKTRLWLTFRLSFDSSSVLGSVIQKCSLNPLKTLSEDQIALPWEEGHWK